MSEGKEIVNNCKTCQDVRHSNAAGILIIELNATFCNQHAPYKVAIHDGYGENATYSLEWRLDGEFYQDIPWPEKYGDWVEYATLVKDGFGVITA